MSEVIYNYIYKCIYIYSYIIYIYIYIYIYSHIYSYIYIYVPQHFGIPRPEDLATSTQDLSVRMVTDGSIFMWIQCESRGFKWTVEGLQNFNVLLSLGWDICTFSILLCLRRGHVL